MNTTDFIAGASALISLAAVGFSYFTFRRSLSAAARPILIFSMTSSYRWRIDNVGSGPAINIMVGDRNRDGAFISITNCYPLSPGGRLDLPWLEAGIELVVVYTDVYDNAYTTICNWNRNRILSRNEFPEWEPNREQWFEMILAEGREESALTVKDLEGKTPRELEIMRNEIYARKGYIFRRKDLADYFGKQPWYEGVTADQGKVFRQLSAGDKYEAHLILQYQTSHGLRAADIASAAGPGGGGELRWQEGRRSEFAD